MGKPIKLSDRKKEWYLRSRKSEVRRLDALAERERVLIVCEGEKTEPNYFKAIKAELPRHVVEVELHGEGDNTLGGWRRPRCYATKGRVATTRSIRSGSSSIAIVFLQTISTTP